MDTPPPLLLWPFIPFFLFSLNSLVSLSWIAEGDDDRRESEKRRKGMGREGVHHRQFIHHWLLSKWKALQGNL